jgi:hypothetical protein
MSPFQEVWVARISSRSQVRWLSAEMRMRARMDKGAQYLERGGTSADEQFQWRMRDLAGPLRAALPPLN